MYVCIGCLGVVFASAIIQLQFFWTFYAWSQKNSSATAVYSESLADKDPAFIESDIGSLFKSLKWMPTAQSSAKKQGESTW